MPANDDPDFDAAKDVATRFEVWLRAVATLGATDGGDFIPELKTTWELSHVRKDSAAMPLYVCCGASRALSDWAGIKPRPTDPKFR